MLANRGVQLLLLLILCGSFKWDMMTVWNISRNWNQMLCKCVAGKPVKSFTLLSIMLSWTITLSNTILYTQERCCLRLSPITCTLGLNFCRPNEGFVDQLKLYESMGWQVDRSHPLFRNYQLQRISEMVTCGRGKFFLR